MGAFLASTTLYWLFPSHTTLGATLPAGAASQSWIFEFILTLILMVVILAVTSGTQEQAAFTGVAVGAVIALEALFAGPVSGASMNPVRSLAPAAVAGRWEHLWIYLTAPMMGAVAGVLIFRGMHTVENPSQIDTAQSLNKSEQS
jgi:aquaporin Z